MDQNIYELLYMALGNDETAFEMMYSCFQGMFNHLYQQISTLCPLYNLADAMDDCRSAMISAVYCYRRDCGLQFSGFVYTCCRRSMLNAVRTLKRSNYYQGEMVYSLDYQLSEESGSYLGEISSAPSGGDFAPALLTLTTIGQLIVEEMSEEDGEVFRLKRMGYSYLEISRKLGIPYKKVDNILQKVKRKIISSFDY